MAEIQVRTHTAASIDATWAVLADQVGMSLWTPARASVLERQGGPEGVGAIRSLSFPPLTFREQITASHAPDRLAYRMLSGLPVRDYTGETRLTTTGAGTDIVWTVRVRQTVPGLTAVIRVVVRGLATGLATHAERVAAQHRG